VGAFFGGGGEGLSIRWQADSVRATVGSEVEASHNIKYAEVTTKSTEADRMSKTINKQTN